MSPMASKRRRLLYQSTHSIVASSTASRLRHGPLRRISSVLNTPMIDFGHRVVVGVADRPDGWLSVGLGEPFGIANRGVLATRVAVMNQALDGVPGALPLPDPHLEGVQDQVGGHRPCRPPAGDH